MEQENDFYNENEFAGESPVNYEQKCPCVLVIDTSYSMYGAPINELNEGLKLFQEQVLKDITAASRLEISVITFDSSVKVVQNFALLDSFDMPALFVEGTTKLVDGVKVAIQKVKARKDYYKETHQKYYRPYVILVTDGAPDPDQDIDELKEEIIQGELGKHFVFWAFGVEQADMNMLKYISNQFPPKYIKGTDFSTFFKWLSSSMTTISKSKVGDKIDLRPKKEEDPFASFDIN